MTSSILVALLAVVLVILSVRERLRQRHFRKEWDMIGESKNSALSESLAGLVGTAGGIYLSTVMLTTFLEIEIPSRVNIHNVSLEPMAALSFILAIFSPYINRLLGGLKRLKFR